MKKKLITIIALFVGLSAVPAGVSAEETTVEETPVKVTKDTPEVESSHQELPIETTGNDVANEERSMEGKAYAVLLNTGDFIFFRSNEIYSNASSGTFTDIIGNKYSGTVYSEIETLNVTDLNNVPWDGYWIKSVRVADEQIIVPVSMSFWFYACRNLTNVDLSGFDTKNVVNMRGMFWSCSSLTSLDVSSLDTSNVTDMAWMFCECINLTGIDVSNFDTSNVTNMNGMFSECEKLTSINAGKFDTSSVTNMKGMFDCCISLRSLDLSSFDTSKVTDMDGMFFRCEKLTSIDLSSFDTVNVTNLGYMFFGCVSVKTIYASEKWNLKNATESSWMFESCHSLPNFDSNYIDKTRAYYGDGGYLTYKPYSGEEDDHSAERLSGTYQYSSLFSTADDHNLIYNYTYDDNWFFSNSERDKYNLVKMSIRTAMAAYGLENDYSTYKAHGPMNIVDLMNKLSFKDQSIHYPEPEYHTIGYAIGHRDFTDSDGNKKSVVLVAVRGGGYGAEWGGNFYVGNGLLSSGFAMAASDVISGLDDYLMEHSEIKNRDFKIWLTGFSRAAATSNLVAAMLDNNNLDGVSSKNVCAFCFECPFNTRDKNAADRKYDNIINIVNPIDFVPKVPMAKWGFTRYGKTYYIPSLEANKDYYAYKDKMSQAYEAVLEYTDPQTGRSNQKSIDPKIIYESSVSPVTENLGAFGFGQASWLDKVMDDFAGIAPLWLYNFLYQDDLVKITAQKLGNYDEADPKWIQEIPLVATLSVVHPMAEGYLVGLFLAGPSVNYSVGGYAHYPELCLSWIDSLSGFNEYNTDSKSKYREIKINCPVNVTVLNSAGEIAAQIIDDEVLKIENGIAAGIDENDQKVILAPIDEEYRVDLTATDDGNVTYSVTEYNSAYHKNERVVSYYEVEVKKGDKLSGTIDNLEEAEHAEYPLIFDEETPLVPDVDEEGDAVTGWEVTINSKGSGTVSGGGNFVSGEFSKVTATPVDDAEFYGWYQGDNLITTDREYRFRVTENIELTAIFSGSENEIILNKNNISVISGKTFSLNATVFPEDAEDKTITWISSDETIAAVDQNGNVKGVKPGNAIIAAKTANGLIAACDVRVLFTDVANDKQYFYEPVYWALDNEITVGAGGPGKFSPSASCTREQFVTFLWRQQGKPSYEKGCDFTDVPKDAWYYEPISWAAENGITTGLNDGTGRFGVGQACTREQCVTFLHRAADTPEPEGIIEFTDSLEGRYYYKAIKWAAGKGITVGLNDGTGRFGVGQKCTRGMLVTFLYRFDQSK